MNGTYGTIKPATVDIAKDVQIFYNYKPNRSYENSKTFNELAASNLLNVYAGEETTVPISGLYNLRLPLTIFGNKGIYTVYIKPKEMKKTIKTVGVLNDFPDVRGVIFEAIDFEDEFKDTNALVGYRIDYNVGSSNEYSRIITSSNLCELVPQNLNKQNKYRFSDNDNANLIFCTVTPSTTSSLSNTPPPIGTNMESVNVVNTKFNPVMFEIEMVEHDAETLSYLVGGDQLRNLENGTFTIYNNDKGIYRQFETYTVKTQLGKPLFDVKANKYPVDTTQEYDKTIGSF